VVVSASTRVVASLARRGGPGERGEECAPVAVVRVEPLGAEIELLPGEALADAAWRLGFVWPTTCWGQADCMLCRVRIVGGEEFVDPAAEEESEALRVRLPVAARAPGVRLACRLKVHGDGVIVEKSGVRPPPGTR
jgi:2Fe-2S ferredoxin